MEGKGLLDGDKEFMQTVSELMYERVGEGHVRIRPIDKRPWRSQVVLGKVGPGGAGTSSSGVQRKHTSKPHNIVRNNLRFHLHIPTKRQKSDMSGQPSVGGRGVYEAGDQRNAPNSEENKADRYKEGQPNSHKANDSSA